MTNNVEKVIKELGKAFLIAYKASLYSNKGINKKVNKNTLIDSSLDNDTITRVFDNGGDAMVELLINQHIHFVESGRRKGAKFPPIEPIVRWCRSKGLPTDNSTVFLIRRAISRDGIQPRPILDTVFEDMDAQMEQIYFDKIFDSIITQLNNYFNNI